MGSDELDRVREIVLALPEVNERTIRAPPTQRGSAAVALLSGRFWAGAIDTARA